MFIISPVPEELIAIPRPWHWQAVKLGFQPTPALFQRPHAETSNRSLLASLATADTPRQSCVPSLETEVQQAQRRVATQYKTHNLVTAKTSPVPFPNSPLQAVTPPHPQPASSYITGLQEAEKAGDIEPTWPLGRTPQPPSLAKSLPTPITGNWSLGWVCILSSLVLEFFGSLSCIWTFLYPASSLLGRPSLSTYWPRFSPGSRPWLL